MSGIRLKSTLRALKAIPARSENACLLPVRRTAWKLSLKRTLRPDTGASSLSRLRYKGGRLEFVPLIDRKTSQPQPEEIRRSKNTATKSAVAKVVNVGDEQYVILPKGFWVSAEEVWIEALADGSLLIREKTRSAGGGSPEDRVRKTR